MGFSGGGSNILKSHTHNGLTVQDGGSLNFNDITQSQSSAGMVFFSDGTHLQQLAYPGVPAGETLTAAAASTAPSWAAGGGGVTTNQQHDFLGADFSTTSTSAVTTGLSLTATNSTGGTCGVLCCGAWWSEPADTNVYSVLYDDGSAISGTVIYYTGGETTSGGGNARNGWSLVWAIPTDGSVLDVRAYVATGATVVFAGTTGNSSMTLNEVY
jgi:hypothetical protein